MDLKGYSIGGLAVGEPQAVMLDMLDITCPGSPAEKPRYLMGVGTPDDILKSVARGIDMFDCVMPTRAGRHGLAYTRRGKINLRNARHADDPRPLDEESDCPAARDYSRAYLHHLVKSQEALGAMLLTWNNLAYYQRLMQDIRGVNRGAGFRRPAAGDQRRMGEGRLRRRCESGPSGAERVGRLQADAGYAVSAVRLQFQRVDRLVVLAVRTKDHHLLDDRRRTHFLDLSEREVPWLAHRLVAALDHAHECLEVGKSALMFGEA